MNKHILVVDDEAPVRFIMGRILRNSGYTVSEAPDGRQARLMLMSTNQNHVSFDLVLLDLQMPFLSGDELLRELSRFEFCPPVLLMSGALAEKQKDLLKNEYCVGMITKPFKADDVLEAVSKAFFALPKKKSALGNSGKQDGQRGEIGTCLQSAEQKVF